MESISTNIKAQFIQILMWLQNIIINPHILNIKMDTLEFLLILVIPMTNQVKKYRKRYKILKSKFRCQRNRNNQRVKVEDQNIQQVQWIITTEAKEVCYKRIRKITQNRISKIAISMRMEIT